MIRVPVRDLAGAEVAQAELDERVFGITPNRAVLHQVVVAQLAGARKGTHDTKTRGEVAGGGAKPWRQKGTGRARQGSTRAPHWRKGGVVFGPHPRSYTQRTPLKMRRLAMRSALSDKLASEALTVIRDFTLEAPKTKLAIAALSTLGMSGRTLIVLGGVDDAAKRSVSNLEDVRVVSTGGMNLLDVINARNLLLSPEAIQALNASLTLGLSAADEVAAVAPAAPAEEPAPAARPRTRTRAAKPAPEESEETADAGGEEAR